MRSVALCTDTSLGNEYFNSVGQSPCYIASALANVCMGGGFALASLNSTQPTYPGPLVADVNSCMCSSVYYSLLSACSICQGFAYLRWSEHASNCERVYDHFPEAIPADTSVPHYAYLDVRAADSFNSRIALLSVRDPQTLTITSTVIVIATKATSTPNSTSTTHSPSGTLTIFVTVDPSTTTTTPDFTSTTTTSDSASMTITSDPAFAVTTTSAQGTGTGSYSESPTQPTLTPTQTDSSAGGVSLGLILGPTVGGILLLAGGAILIWAYVLRRRRANSSPESGPQSTQPRSSTDKSAMLNPPTSRPPLTAAQYALLGPPVQPPLELNEDNHPVDAIAHSQQ